MKISVITCTWNSAHFLEQCIDSVTSQSHKDVEYIFVDGGSYDRTLELINKVNTSKKVAFNVRGGISNAMNRGIELASGDIVVHLHSDDYFSTSEVLSKVNNHFLNSNNLWLFGRCLSDINGVLEAENYDVPSYSYKRLLKGNFIPHPATFIRKECFSSIGVFDTAIKYAMDYDLWLRLGKVSEPLQLDEHLAVFRRHRGSLSTANRLAAFEEDYAVRCKYAETSLFSKIYHFAHYIVRSRRVRQAVRSDGGKL